MAGRHNPPDHRGPEAVAGLRQRQRRLSDPEALLLAGVPAPDIAEGARVRVLFSEQDPIDGVITEPTDHGGWVKVRASMDGFDETYEFLALASCCVVLGDGDAADNGMGC